MIQRRLLPPDEWHRLADYEPFKSGGLPDPDLWRIVVAEDEGRIIGFCGLFETVHWDPWWVDPDYRGNPVVFKDLIAGGVEVMIDHHIQQVHVTIPHDRPDLERMLTRFGFKPAPGTLYYFARD